MLQSKLSKSNRLRTLAIVRHNTHVVQERDMYKAINEVVSTQLTKKFDFLDAIYNLGLVDNTIVDDLCTVSHKPLSRNPRYRKGHK